MINWLFKFNWKQGFQYNHNWLPPVRKHDGSVTRVFVGVSGGVDSSVAAALLKKRGYDVTGVFMKTYYPPQLKCDWQAERLDAMRVCTHLNIPFKDCDLEKEYKEEVFDYMIESYRKGITPNPDIFCNKYVKFGGFLKWAETQGCDYIATGHYSQNFQERFNLEEDEVRGREQVESREESFVHHLGVGADTNKDQTYFLYQLTQEKLQKALFPIGHLPKEKVRKLAKKFGLFTASKKDSQGLCFVGPVDMKEFLKEYINENPGIVLNLEGKEIGTHDGSFFLTIGQRHGFNINPEHMTPEMPKLFVLNKDTESNTVTVGPKNVKETVGNSYLTITEANWVREAPEIGEELQSRIRHRGRLLVCMLKETKNNTYVFSFKTSHTDVAPGQSLVLYKEDVCLGGGIVINN